MYKGVCGPPAPVVEFLLNALAALIQGVTSQVYDVEGVHDRGCFWELFSGCALKPGESIHRDDLNALTPRVGLGGQPDFEDPLGATRDHVQEPRAAATVSYRSHVQDNGDDSCPRTGCGATRVHPRQ